jgi:hypothetical protein
MSNIDGIIQQIEHLGQTSKTVSGVVKNLKNIFSEVTEEQKQEIKVRLIERRIKWSKEQKENLTNIAYYISSIKCKTNEEVAQILDARKQEDKKQRKDKIRTTDLEIQKEKDDIHNLEEQLKKLKDEWEKDATKFEELQKKLDILLQKWEKPDAEETKEEDDIIAIKQKIKEIVLTFYDNPDFTQSYGSKLCEDIRHKMDEEGIDSKKHNSIMVDILGKEIQKKDKLMKTGEITVEPEEKTVKTTEDTSGDTEKKKNKKTLFGWFSKIFSRKTNADGDNKAPKEKKATREEKNRAKEQQKRQDKINTIMNDLEKKIDGGDVYIIDFHIEALRGVVENKEEFLKIWNQLNKKNFWLSIMRQPLPKLDLTEEELIKIWRENEDDDIRQEIKTKLHISQVELERVKDKYSS